MTSTPEPSTPPAAANTASPSNSAGDLSTGAKAGIGVGAVLGAVALFGLALWLGWILRKRRQSPSQDLPTGDTEAKYNTRSMWESSQGAYRGPGELPGTTSNYELDGRQIPAEAGH